MSELIATPSATDANAYLTAEEADTLTRSFEPRAKDVWDAVTDLEEWNWVLMRAAIDIDSYREWGEVKVPGQALAFPRSVDQADEIHERIKRATMAIVELYLNDDMLPIKKLQAEGVENASILGMSADLGEERTGLPARARKELDELIKSHWPVRTRHRDEADPLPGQDYLGTFYGGESEA